MRKVNIHDAKTNFSRLVELAAAGEEIVIARAGRPLARLMPLADSAQPRRLGALVGQVRETEGWWTPDPGLAALFDGAAVEPRE